MNTVIRFQHGNNEPFETPEGTAVDPREFFVRKTDKEYVLYPNEDPWLPLRLSIGQMSEDFMDVREQPLWTQTEGREEC